MFIIGAFNLAFKLVGRKAPEKFQENLRAANRSAIDTHHGARLNSAGASQRPERMKREARAVRQAAGLSRLSQ